MPPEPESYRPHTSFRVEADLWARFGEAAGNRRASLLREFIRWWLRMPGAKLPVRPGKPD
jgi:hypothetical protein